MMCETYNQLGQIAGEMGFRAGLHNHLGQMVQTQEEIDQLHGDDGSEAVLVLARYGAFVHGGLRSGEESGKYEAA